MIYVQRSKNLVKCLTDGNKLELAELISDLIPNGKPDLIGVVNYPKISKLIEENGRQGVRATIFLIVKNFCESLNVVRGMNEDQMIEAASFLIDECGNYRIEDYLIMFTMAKRGQLVKILDRLDIQIIGQIFSEYDRLRYMEGERAYMAEIKAADTITNDKKEHLSPEEIKKQESNFNKAVEMFKEYVQKSEEKRQQKMQFEKEEFEKKRLKMLADFEQYKKDHGLPSDTPMIDLGFKKDKNVKA